MANRICYQFYCNECGAPYEIMMSLAELDEYDEGDEEIDCPNCGEGLNKLICPARLSSSRCTI
jgi:DNA-directed RNA polymerase subunit RPC12/RpoP